MIVKAHHLGEDQLIQALPGVAVARSSQRSPGCGASRATSSSWTRRSTLSAKFRQLVRPQTRACSAFHRARAVGGADVR
jgi:hypothetical protein